LSKQQGTRSPLSQLSKAAIDTGSDGFLLELKKVNHRSVYEAGYLLVFGLS